MSLFNIFNTDPRSKELYHTDGIIPANLHPTLAKSWLRSSQYHINPNIIEAPLNLQFNLSELDQLLLDVAKPFFEYFGNLGSQSECALALSNRDGIIIHTDIPSKSSRSRQSAERHNLIVGADWKEKSVGTNAIGTVIEERINIFLFGLDLFSLNFNPYSAAGSPIFNLKNGEVLGTMATAGFELHPHSLGWVTAIARLIERELNDKMIMKAKIQERINQEKPYQSLPNISIKPHKLAVEIAGEHPVFRSTLKDAEKIARTNLNVLLIGETGTGKEILAQYIHHYSNRAQGPFVAVNCAAIPKDLVSSELFGYIDGAFTGASRRGYPGRFEQADGGTLFLDEIGDASYEVQVGLLRVLEEKTIFRLGSGRCTPVNVRVLAATSLDLTALINKGLFREDLYYRLAGLIIDMPALRDRGQDIILLAEYFLEKHKNTTVQNLVFDPKLKQSMLEYDWPGNIRELRNIVERMVALAESEILTRDLFIKCLQRRGERIRVSETSDKEILINAIKQAKGNITRVSEFLAIDRTTVYRRMKKFGLKSKNVI